MQQLACGLWTHSAALGVTRARVCAGCFGTVAAEQLPGARGAAGLHPSLGNMLLQTMFADRGLSASCALK